MPASPAVITAAERAITRVGQGRFQLNEDVQLQDLVFNRVDEFGTVWIISDVQGWWTTPEPVIDDVAKSWQDGSFPTTGRYGPRVITLTGSFFPANTAYVATSRDQLVRALNLVRSGGWFLTREMGWTKGSQVYLSAQPQIETVNAAGRTDFSIGLRAPDPIKYHIVGGEPAGYGSVAISSSSLALPGRTYPRTYPWSYPQSDVAPQVALLNNIGNYRTYPVFELTGPTSGFTSIVNITTGQRMRMARGLGTQEVLTIDCLTRQVRLGPSGNQRSYLTLDTEWIHLVPGMNQIYFADEGGSSEDAFLNIKWRSGWIA